MAIELRQQLKLTQQLIMTPQLQMAIKLLQLSRLELVDTIRQELEENPALEELQETVSAEHPEQEEPVAEAPSENQEIAIQEKLTDDMDWSNYIDEYNSPGHFIYESEGRESPRFEAFVAHKKSLTEHLLWQLMMVSPTEEQQRISSLIAGNLTANGYLDISLDEIALLADASVEKVEEVLWIMQNFDPMGVCARNLEECLMIQAKQLDLKDTIVTEIIQNHLHLLENRNIKAICKAIKCSFKEALAAINVIKSLDPRPGRMFSDDNFQYITPDIYVYRFEDDYVIVLNDDGMPKLRINPFYRNAIEKNQKISDNAKDYIQDKMRSAAWLIRSIHQRQKTIYRVMESILKFQREFFDKGIAYLKPMVLRDVAQDIDMHESTISRVTTNKYAYTPQGIFELKYFFNSSINRVHGGSVASVSVQEKIRKLIESEDRSKPYSDGKIVAFLKQSNINIARRTVAKYREIMRILPSHKRKQF